MDIVNIAALIAACLVLVIYGLYFIYLSNSQKMGQKAQRDRMLEKSSFSTEESKEKDNLSLIKAPTDTYFKSKLARAEGLKEWIQHSGVNIRPPILVAIAILIGIGALFLFYIILRVNIIISLLLGIVSSFFIPWVVISYLTLRRKKQFLEEFPISLDIVRRALRAGHSIDRAINMVVEQLTGPVGLVFKQIVDKLRIGQPLEEVLAEMSNSLGIDDFHMLAIVIVLQRETGGSLAEAIENFSKIIRARQTLRKKVKALTAEVRLTAMILAAIPFAIFGVVYLTTPNYFDPLFYTDGGHKLLMGGIIMLTLGIGIIARMTYKESY